MVEIQMKAKCIKNMFLKYFKEDKTFLFLDL